MAAQQRHAAPHKGKREKRISKEKQNKIAIEEQKNDEIEGWAEKISSRISKRKD